MLWGYCDPGAAVTANCPTGRTVIDIPTPPPFAEPTTRPMPTDRPVPRSTPSATRECRRDAEQRLERLAPSIVYEGCSPFPPRRDHDAAAAGAFAAISCDFPARGIEELAYDAFRRDVDLDDYFFQRLDELSGTVPSRFEACVGGTRGWTTWAHGMIARWVSQTGTRKAHVRWTDDRHGTSGILDATDRDVIGLYSWWTVWLQ